MSLILPLEKYRLLNERHHHETTRKKKIKQQRSDESVLYYHKTTISTKLKRKNGIAFLTTIADNNNSIKRNDCNNQIQQERHLRQKSDFSKLPSEQSSRNILIENELFTFSNKEKTKIKPTDRKQASICILEQKDENDTERTVFQTSLSNLCDFQLKKDSDCICNDSKDNSNNVITDEYNRYDSNNNDGDHDDGRKGREKSILEAKKLVRILHEIYHHDEQYIKRQDDKRHSEKEIMREAFVANSKNKWRKYFYIQIIPDIRALSHKRQMVRDKIIKLQSKMHCRLLQRAFRLWMSQISQSQSKSFSSKVKFFNAVYFTNKKMNVINALSSISLGHSSQRKVLQGRRDAFYLAQQKLTKNLLKQNETHGSVTPNMIRQEVNKIFFAEILGWTKHRCLRICLGSWYQFTTDSNKQSKEAINFNKNKIKHKVFEKWFHFSSNMSP